MQQGGSQAQRSAEEGLPLGKGAQGLPDQSPRPLVVRDLQQNEHHHQKRGEHYHGEARMSQGSSEVGSAQGAVSEEARRASQPLGREPALL